MAKAILKKLRKTWLKLLKAEAEQRRKKARKLEQKIIQLEFELNDE